MIYKPFKDLKLSALGLGCMRLPQLDKYEHIDVALERSMEISRGFSAKASAFGVNRERASSIPSFSRTVFTVS